MVKKRWSYSEVQVLIDNYESKTIKELMRLLPGRDKDSINCKIKRLKKEGKITSGKSGDVVKRSYSQRERNYDRR